MSAPASASASASNRIPDSEASKRETDILPARRRSLVCFGSGNWPCGIANYHRDLERELREVGGPELSVVTHTYPVGRIRRDQLGALRRREREFRALAARADGADAAIVEFHDSFFNAMRRGECLFEPFLRRVRPPALVILHEYPEAVEEAPPPPWSRPLRRARRLAADLVALGLEWNRVSTRDPDRWIAGLFGNSDIRIAVHDPALAARLVRLGVPASRVLARPHPIQPLGAATAAPEAARARFGLPADPAIRFVGLFGFPVPRRGFDVAVRALARLPENIHLVLTGGSRGPDDDRARGQLRELAESLGAGGRFHLVGWLERPELADLFSTWSLGLAPFREVTGSGSTAFLMEAGLPVVASDLPALREIRDMGAGLRLATPDDPAALADAALALLRDDDARAALAARSRAFAEDHSMRRFAREILQEILPPATAPARG